MNEPIARTLQPISASQVVEQDLDDICSRAAQDLRALAGTRVLVTGGAGFLGYYVVQAMTHWNERNDRQIDVVVHDNFMRGVADWLSALGAQSKVSLVRRDVTEPLSRDLDPFDYVVHGASIASPTFYRRHPIATMDANVVGIRNLLDFCVDQSNRDRPPKSILFYSSSEIYGDPPPEHIPTTETYRGNVSCTGPRACYDESKRYGETLCVNFVGQFGLPVKIARPFNNYGPGLKITDRRALPDFARDVFAGRDIVLLSDGRPSRTFCYVSDAVVGYLAILVRGRPGEAYNIGADAPEVSIRELAEMVVASAAEQFGYRGRVVGGRSDDRDYLVDNPNRRCPDISKARAELNYTPRIPVNEGVARSLVWYMDNQDAEDS